MTRSRASAKSAGTKFETLVATYLNATVDDRIERRAKNGALDRGDLSGIRTFRNGRVVAQCKDYGGQFKVGTWLNQVDLQRGTDDAIAGLVVAKRRGTTNPGEQVVIMTLDDLIAILTGERPPALTTEARKPAQMPRQQATNTPLAPDSHPTIPTGGRAHDGR